MHRCCWSERDSQSDPDDREHDAYSEQRKRERQHRRHQAAQSEIGTPALAEGENKRKVDHQRCHDVGRGVAE